MWRAIAWMLIAMAAISCSFAAVLVLALDASPLSSLAFATWCAALGIGALHGPRGWLSGVEFTVTTNHVIWRRGPFRRSIERKSISFARIFWRADAPGTGDLELVRAVPTGALRRRLTLRLPGVSAPDRVWAIIRGEEKVAPTGVGNRPLAQRLDQGERVLWSARPRPSARAYLPTTKREWMLVAISAFLLLSMARLVWTGVPTLHGIIEAGLPANSAAFVLLVIAMALTALAMLAVASYLAWDAVVRRARLVRETRYLITNKRVLIQRGREELHLDRTRIVDVIDTPARGGLYDVFLVLDGPRARALAASGAFGELERSPHLRPVFESVQDAEGASRILRQPSEPNLPRAA